MTQCNRPLTVLCDNGERIPVFPSRTLAVVANGPECSLVWHFDAEGFIEQIHVSAELAHVRAALGLEDLDDEA